MRPALSLIVAAAILASIAQTAAASRFGFNTGSHRVTWSSLEFGNTLNETVVRCKVTLEGSFHSLTVAKTTGLLIGYITRFTKNACTNGDISDLFERTALPWHRVYLTYFGSLPNFISDFVNWLRGVRIDITAGGITCTLATETENPASLRYAIESGTVTSAAFDSRTTIPLRGGPFGACALGRGYIAGTGTVTQTGSSTRVTTSLTS